MKWTNENLMAVICAVQRDQRDNSMSANVRIVCPVCKQSTLDYDRVKIFNLVAWCKTCNTGLKQGDELSGC